MSDVVGRSKAALEGITEGPWEHRVGPEDETPAEYFNGTLINSGEPLHVLIAPSVEPQFAYVVPAITGDGPGSARNAEFIAQARTLVPELVAEIERLRATVEQVRELADGWMADAGPESKAHNVFGEQVVTVKFAAESILAALEADR